eukprot:gene24396-10000_t
MSDAMQHLGYHFVTPSSQLGRAPAALCHAHAAKLRLNHSGTRTPLITDNLPRLESLTLSLTMSRTTYNTQAPQRASPNSMAASTPSRGLFRAIFWPVFKSGTQSKRTEYTRSCGNATAAVMAAQQRMLDQDMSSPDHGWHDTSTAGPDCNHAACQRVTPGIMTSRTSPSHENSSPIAKEYDMTSYRARLHTVLPASPSSAAGYSSSFYIPPPPSSGEVTEPDHLDDIVKTGGKLIDSIGAVSSVDEALMKIDAAFMMCYSLNSIDRLVMGKPATATGDIGSASSSWWYSSSNNNSASNKHSTESDVFRPVFAKVGCIASKAVTNNFITIRGFDMSK